MAQEHISKFMERFDLQFPDIDIASRTKVLACIEDFVAAGENTIDLPANDDNVVAFMTAAMKTRYGPNFARDSVREWVKMYTPGLPANIGMAMFMSMACLGLRGEKLATIVRDTVLSDWTDKMTVWELMCLVPFFFTLKDKQ